MPGYFSFQKADHAAFRKVHLRGRVNGDDRRRRLAWPSGPDWAFVRQRYLLEWEFITLRSEWVR
jgi:hypothetical protein